MTIVNIIIGSTLFAVIVIMGPLLGNKLKFYDKYFWWDLLIHFLAGIAFISFGIAIAQTVEHLNNFHILFFSLTFSMFLHTLWEIGEYLVDKLLGTNHQRWQEKSASGKQDGVQPDGLVDTMHDSIACLAGALVACACWWFILP